MAEREDRDRFDRLDRAVEATLRGHRIEDGAGEDDLGALVPLVRVAEELCVVPRESFRARLAAELRRSAEEAKGRTGVPVDPGPPERGEIMETAVATRALTPYLIVRGAARAIEFYRTAFGAKEKMRLAEPSGRIGHAELEIFGSPLMLADEYPEYGTVGPEALGGSGVTLSLQVDDVDAVFARALAAGARVLRAVNNEFYGDRAGKLADPFGHVWSISTRVEEVAPAEMQKRFEAILGQAVGEEPEAAPAAPPPSSPIQTVTPYLHVRDASGLAEFVKEAFGASEAFRAIGSAGGLHIEVRIGDSRVMIGGVDDPSFEEIPAAIYLHVPDVDAVYERALRAGAVSTQAPADQPYGERTAFLKDRFGNTWYVATPIRDGKTA